MTSPVFSPVVEFSVTMSPLCYIDATHNHTHTHSYLTDYSSLFTTSADQQLNQSLVEYSANSSSISASATSTSSHSASALSHHLFPAFAPCKPGRHKLLPYPSCEYHQSVASNT